MDPGSLPPRSLAARPLPEIYAELTAVLKVYPELRRGGRQLLAEIDRVLGTPTPAEESSRDRRRVDGLP